MTTLSNSTYPAPTPADFHRDMARTPSPSPSEQAALDSDGKPHLKRIFKREHLKQLLALAVILVLVLIMYLYHDQIVDGLRPVARWMHDRPGGWLIPIAVMIVLSFPPLFGQEIVIVLVGLTWGLGVGFAIAAAGTLIGELINFFVFRYFCSARGQKVEENNIRYATLARAVREGGLVIAIIARYSTIPGHVTTMVFSVCGMSVWIYLIAAVVSLPKQFATLYLGYALEQAASSQTSKRTKIAQYLVIGVTIIVTIVAGLYIRRKQQAVKPAVIYERRKRRQALKYGGSPDSTSYPPASTVASGDQMHQPQPMAAPVSTRV